MSAYNLLLRLITVKNKSKKNGHMTDDEYENWKTNTLAKMDTFLICDRLTEEQYKELEGMFA